MHSIHGPSDHQCLRAAERLLAEHLATRPATTTEAGIIAAGHRAEAASLLAEAEQLEHAYRHPLTAAEIGRGPQSPAQQHVAHVSAVKSLQEAVRVRQRAIRPTLRAEAWEAIAGDPASAWDRTRRELEGRVAHYRGRIEARRAASAGTTASL